MNKHLKGNEKQSVQKRAGEEKFCNNKNVLGYTRVYAKLTEFKNAFAMLKRLPLCKI